ncbi:MAG: M20/M25/M40 family metallo-hydrolase [Planctomycetes bacterium]|nr:M20/M25/M40 family metallo-hydrolase [Planctomycetota bacterium]
MQITQDQIADSLSQITRIQRVSGNEHGVIEWFKHKFTQHGLQFKHSGRNLLAWRGSGKRRLLLNTHTDTVPANRGYTRDPWDGARENGRVYGLGSSDAGGCLMGMLYALLTAKFDEAACTLMFAPTCDEEVQGEGFELFRAEIPEFEACITGEPTDCEVCIAERGMFKLDMKTSGKSSHAARPWQGENAIYRAARDMLRVEELYEGFTERDDLLGRTTLAVTMVNGGVARNVVPSEVKWVIDGRTINQLDNAETIKRVKAAMSEHTCVEKEKARFGVWVRSASDPLVRCACKASSRDKTQAFGGVSDAWWNDKAQGLIIGPGKPELSHAANEYLEEKELYRGYEIYRKTAELYLNG